MSQRQADAIKAWWDARKAAGEFPPKTPEQKRAKSRRDYRMAMRKNPDRLRRAAMARYHRNREAILAQRRLARQRRAEELRAADRRRRALNPGLFAARSRAKYMRHKPAILERNRRSRRKHLYGLTHDRFLEMMSEQNGKCAICSAPIQDGRNQHVDHCHTTGAVRGLLCSFCNRGLGCFRDSQIALLNAAAYVARHATAKKAG